MHRVPYDQLRETLELALRGLGLAPARAALSARLIACTDLDGVGTHGIARFGRFAAMVAAGDIDPLAEPSLTTSFGALERWNGNGGPGNLAAHAAMARAMELASAHGLGGVALANTNHWQRGGTYGWQAAEAGYAAICWTNTMPNLPAWGATVPTVGNNPLVIAVPRTLASGEEAPVVLDMAMSQFSYGSLAAYRDRGAPLPVPGGYDREGRLTTDPGEIESTERALPIGFWKGSGLAFALDVLGALLADGQATHQIPRDPLKETGITQVFLAVAPRALESAGQLSQLVDDAIAFPQAADRVDPGQPPRYPGEAVLATRKANLKRGVPIPADAWENLLRMGRL